MKKIAAPFWFHIFPECKKFDMRHKQIFLLNRKFSVEHQLPEFTNVLIPKVEIFHAALCAFVTEMDALYDLTIVYKTDQAYSHEDWKVPTFTELLQRKPFEVHCLIKRYSKEQLIQYWKIDEDIEKMYRDNTAEFLMNLFERKDKSINVFYQKSDQFMSDESIPKYQLQKINFISILPGMILFTSSAIILFKSRFFNRNFLKAYLCGSLFSLIVLKVEPFLEKFNRNYKKK